MPVVSIGYRVNNWQASPLLAGSSVMNSTVIGNGLGFEGLNTFAQSIFPDMNLEAIQGFEVRISDSLNHTAVISAILQKPEVIGLVAHRVEVNVVKAPRGGAHLKMETVLSKLEDDLFLVSGRDHSPIRLELVLGGRGKPTSLTISQYPDSPKHTAIKGARNLEERARQFQAHSGNGIAGVGQAVQDRAVRRQLGIGDRERDAAYEQQLRPLVALPQEQPPRPVGIVGTIARRLGHRTKVEKIDDTTQQIRLNVASRSDSDEPRNHTMEEFYKRVEGALRKNGFHVYGHRAHWIDFKNKRNKDLDKVATDPRKLYKLFIKPNSEHFFTVMDRVLAVLRGEEYVYGKFWRNPQESRKSERGNDPYNDSHEPTFLLYFYGFDADFELTRIAELIERQFTPEELTEFGAEEQVRLDWDEVGPGESGEGEVRSFDERGNSVQVKVKKIKVLQRGPSFTDEVTPNGFLFWGQGGFSESERYSIATQYQYQATLRARKLAEIFNGDNFCKYKGISEPFTTMYEDRKLLQRVREREFLLFTHSTSLENAIKIAQSGELKRGRNGKLGFRYGINFSYGPNGMVTFIMKKDFNVDHTLDDSFFGIKREGETNEEFRRRCARNLIFLSDIPTAHYLDKDGEEEKYYPRGIAGRTAFLSVDYKDDPEKPVFVTQLPQIDLDKDVQLSEVYAIIVPEHVYEQFRKEVLKTNPSLADRIRIIKDTGTTEEEYMAGIANMPKRSRINAGQHTPIIGFKAAHRYFTEYLKTVVEATER